MNGPLLPQPEEISEAEKDDAMGAYFMMFASWAIGLPLPLLNLVAALIYHVLNSRQSRYVAFHAYQSLLSQIPVTLLNVGVIGWLVAIILGGSSFVPLFFLYLIVVVVANLLYLIFSVVALVRARRGEIYYIPLFGRLSFSRYYGKKAVSLQTIRRNRAPEGLE